jgi:hypothetical protein
VFHPLHCQKKEYLGSEYSRWAAKELLEGPKAWSRLANSGTTPGLRVWHEESKGDVQNKVTQVTEDWCNARYAFIKNLDLFSEMWSHGWPFEQRNKNISYI